MASTSASSRGYDPGLDFWGLVNWHLDNGTRAKLGLGPHRPGPVWDNKEFANVCGASVRRVQYWRQTDSGKRRTVPPFLKPIEDAFFGDNEAYDGDCTWRSDLRAAHAKAKTPSDNFHTPGLSTTVDEIADTLILDDPRATGRHGRETVGPADSLVAKFAKDHFLERHADQDFLGRFLTSRSSDETEQQFRWALVTGPAGSGKTRLAIEFLGSAEALGFRAGFLDLENLKKFESSGWRPNQPTLVVIDYASQSPRPVATMLKEFVETACRPGFDHPVRMLLLERRATGDWFKRIAPMDSTGAGVRNFCYRENDERWDYPLTSLSSDALLAIMRGRLPDAGVALSKELLLATLKRIDPPADGDDEQSTPRPLFAAATALKIADMMESGEDTTTVISELQVSKLQREDVLAWIIDREREHFWTDGDAVDKRTEQERLRIHENLLAIATMALDIPRQKYDDDCPDAAREYLPDWRTLDKNRFRRMAGADPVATLKRLEPDILGEFFVLDRLKGLSARERQSLIDAGLLLGGDASALFLIRCALDFPEKWRGLGFLKPSIPGPATRAFAEAAFGISYFLHEGRFDDIAAVVSDAKELADRYADPQLRELVAKALFNKGGRLKALGRSEEAIAVYDDVVSRYGTAAEPALRELVAKALVNKGATLGALRRSEEAIAVYDDVFSRYGTAAEPALRELVAKALVNKAFTLGRLRRSDEAIAASDDVVSRYGTATDAALREEVANALFSKGVTLWELQRSDEAIAVYGDIVSRYGTAAEPVLRGMVAKSLINKGIVLGALGRGDEAIAVYDDVVNRYGTATEPALRKLVAQTLVNKGLRLKALRRSDEAIAVRDDIVNRYGTAAEPALRELVAQTLVNKGLRLKMLGRSDEAIAVYDDIVNRYGTAAEPALRKLVAKALFNKGGSLRALGRGDEAITVYDHIVDRFGKATDPTLRRLVTETLSNRYGSLGRNQICPCGSGKCYEQCHGSLG